jgi:glycosyltransferase involved in cell wall biosynthesis
MAKSQLLIDWPLTPYTGWGSYGIQLAQAIIARNEMRVVLTNKADRSPHCDPIWLSKLDSIEQFSKKLIDQLKDEPDVVIQTSCKIAMAPIGNVVPPIRVHAEHQVGVAFFERSVINDHYQKGLEQFTLVITGSNWNQAIIEKSGYENAIMIHQGIDGSRFNAVQIPKLLQNPFIIFSGGKLEARKGQDIVIDAFKKFIKICPQALLIACWANIGNVGLNTIAETKYVKGSPSNGDAKSIYGWLLKNDIPSENILVPEIMANAHLPNIIKQADTAVFTSRCEGGTNLMAMETLACGIPTLLSANTGHQDLIEMEMAHLIPVGENGLGKVPDKITKGYGGDHVSQWGETTPEELVEIWDKLWKEKNLWAQRGIRGTAKMRDITWQNSMKKLITAFKERDLC